MAATERRTSEWVDFVGDLLARPLAAFPRALLSARLHETFGSQVGWSWFDSPDRCDFELHTPIPGFPTPEVRAVMDAAVPHHPVLCWVRITGDRSPMSIGRVPVCARAGTAAVQHNAAPAIHFATPIVVLPIRVRPTPTCSSRRYHDRSRQQDGPRDCA